MWKQNKTAGSLWHIFRPPILLKMPFERMKAFIFSSSNFLIFPNLKDSCFFLQKNITVTVKTDILENYIIWYAFYSKFAALTDFEKNQVFFSKKPTFFSKKKQILGILLKSYYFNRMEKQICYILTIKIFQSQNRPEFRHFQFACKRKNKTFALSGWFSFYIINIVENFKMLEEKLSFFWKKLNFWKLRKDVKIAERRPRCHQLLIHIDVIQTNQKDARSCKHRRS